jgi:hypothetical protein
MTEYIRLYPRQTDDDCLFRVEDDAEKLVVRADLRQNTCLKCGKFNEMKALHDGAYNRVAMTTSQDFFSSGECFPIVSARLRQFLEAIVGNAVEYFDTGSGDCFIALPIHVILPDAKSNSYRALNKCRLCGRYSELLWGATPTVLTSEITAGVFHLENGWGISPIWVVSKELSGSLSKAIPKFKGFVKDALTNVVQVRE